MWKLAHGIDGRVMLIVLSMVATLVVLSIVFFDTKTSTNTIRDGQLDLSTWQEQDGVQALDGEWAFYWNRFLDAEDVMRELHVQPDRLAIVPEKWNDYQIDGERVGESGYATYRLTVSGLESGQRMALKFMPLSSAYRAYINDDLIASNGQAGVEAGSFEPGMKPVTVEFDTPSEPFDIIIQISNFKYAEGGMNHSILLGTPNQLATIHLDWLYRDLLLLGGLILAVFYALSMFWMNREARISLYFACVCIVFLSRTLATGSYLIYVLLPDVSVNLLIYINYFTAHWGVLVFSLMIRELFPDYYSDRVRRFFIGMTIVVLALITVVPAYLYARMFILSDILCLVVLGYTSYVTVKAVLRKQVFSVLVYGANLLSLLLVIIDFYYAAINHHSYNGEFSTIGFFAFIFLYAFILARRFSLAFHEVKVLSRRLMELDRLKDAFLANTSHELRTPLHGIISIAESLLQGVNGRPNQEQQRDLSLIVFSGRKLSHLIDDILDMSKLKHAALTLNRKPVHMAPLIESILHVMKQMYPNKPIAWSSDIPQSLPPVYGDENRIIQILYNLIGNAAKFTDSGQVSVVAAHKEGSIDIQVFDTGIGIMPDKLEAIFQPFEQADASITRPFGGVGLGLSITKQLVELHGGRFSVSSTPGQGSTFTVGLPVSDQPNDEPNDEPIVSPNAPRELALVGPDNLEDGQVYISENQGAHILVVDDDRASLQSAVNLLKLEGYAVTAVTNGKNALQQIKDMPDYRLVILDVMMPEMSGYEVCRLIRQTHSFVELPILMVTAKHLPEDLVLGFDAGANDFLVKPFEPAEFRARVRTLIEWKQSMNRAIQSEMAFLQAQIKPHFIYNTLNTIAYFCMRDGARARDLLNNFAEYLRTHFDFKDMSKPILLERELHIVKTYLEIEKERFGSRLDVEFDVDEETLAAKVPPFIIQPLVENAVHHGALKRMEGGMVRISAKFAQGGIRLQVEDNGVGMSADTAASLLSGQRESGIGFRNIQERLRKLYGVEVGVHSLEGEGTSVTFTIPVPRGSTTQ